MPDWLVTRQMWGAKAPRSVTALARATGCTAHYVGAKMGPFPHSSCATKVRAIQAFHMGTRGWSDIAYSALACPHGFAYEGRGPGVRTAANGTNAGNSAHLAICALYGDGDPITPDLMLAMWRARAWLMGSGKCGPERKQHADWKATSCAGPIGRRFKTETPALTPPPPAPEDDMPLTEDEISKIADRTKTWLTEVLWDFWRNQHHPTLAAIEGRLAELEKRLPPPQS